MAMFGAATPSGSGLNLNPGPMPPSNGMGGTGPTSMNGVVAMGNKALDEEARREAEDRQNTPEIQSLVSYVRKCWQQARDHKRLTVEQTLLSSLRQRKGEYDPDKLEKIRQQGGSEIYMMLTSNKCRAASSWLRDALLGQQGERPWSCEPTPVPDLPPDIAEQVKGQAQGIVQQAMQAGYMPQPGEAFALAQSMKDQAMQAVKEEARRRADRMADKMEDQLEEGGWFEAMNDFIDDLVTFPVACIKGPVIRKRRKLDWEPGPNGTYTPMVTEKLVPEFERVSPFDIYPSPDSTGPEDGYFIQRHKLLRQSLLALKGVEGYDSAAIDMVLENYYAQGWQEWIYGDTERAVAEGRSLPFLRQNMDSRIDAIQFWGAVNGRLLLEWGMDEKKIADPTDDYEVELWLINSTVIKCVLNEDPLRRRPYYVTSYAKQPGGFYGNGVPEIIADVQAVCNATARALVNNMGIASGPQVAVVTPRIAQGEELTQMYPWKIWQFNEDTSGTNRPPIEFFQPNPMVADLMAMYEKFETKADDYTGIPRYMVGGESPNIGRTSSGLSMMMQNAGKSIKQVVSNVDQDIFAQMLQRMFDFNMRYSDDPDLKGDISIVVRGANHVVAKDTIQMRRNEFLQVTANPIDMQIIGAEGRATVLREVAKGLELNTDKIVPDAEMMKIKAAMINQQMAAQQAAGPGGAPGQSAATPLRQTNSSTPSGAVHTPAQDVAQ